MYITIVVQQLKKGVHKKSHNFQANRFFGGKTENRRPHFSNETQEKKLLQQPAAGITQTQAIIISNNTKAHRESFSI